MAHTWKIIVTATLLGTASAANACELDGLFGGRYSAFAVMNKHGSAAPSTVDSSVDPLLSSGEMPLPNAEPVKANEALTKTADTKDVKDVPAVDASKKMAAIPVAQARAAKAAKD